jgi:hypothetical protein
MSGDAGASTSDKNVRYAPTSVFAGNTAFTTAAGTGVHHATARSQQRHGLNGVAQLS